EQQIVYEWIVQGAAERRAAPPPTPTQPLVAQAGAQQPARTAAGTWLTVGPGTKLTDVPDACAPASDLGSLVSSDLILPISCGVIPNDADLARILSRVGLRPAVAAATGGAAAPARSASITQDASAAPATNENAANENAQDAATTVAPAAAAPARAAAVGQAPIRAAALGLPAPSEDDPYLTPRGGFCIDRRLPDNTRGITAIAFAPDGRMFLALDSNLARDVDPLILYDAYHPSRSVAIYDWVNNSSRY
ncbi:MAG: hypothetical protein ACK4SA_23645, partial [Caldilinea sp.]